MSEMSDHQRIVVRALEGAERIYFKPFDDQIAVWYGKSLITVYNPRNWAELENKTVKPDPDAVEVMMSDEGFDRQGRCRDKWELVEKE